MMSTCGKCAHSHLLYIVDILLSCRGTSTNLTNIVKDFSLYSQFFGQMVNWSKSFIYFGDDVSNVRRTDEVGKSSFALCRGSFI